MSVEVLELPRILAATFCSVALAGLALVGRRFQGLRPDYIGTAPLATFCRTFGAQTERGAVAEGSQG